MTHLSRVICSWQPSPSDLKCSHSVAKKNLPLITADAAAAAVALCDQSVEWPAQKEMQVIYLDQLAPRSATLLMDGERDTEWNEKRQKVTAARGLWPHWRESGGGGSLWPLHPACYQTNVVATIRIDLCRCHQEGFAELVNQLNMPWCHLVICHHLGTMCNVLSIWHPAPMWKCSKESQAFIFTYIYLPLYSKYWLDRWQKFIVFLHST